MLKITVERQLGSYPVFIGYDLLSKAADIFQMYKFSGRILLISTPALEAQHRSYLHQILGTYRGRVFAKLIPKPEAALNLNTISEVLSFLVKNEFDQNSAILSFGGNAIHAIAGFAARLFLNEIAFVPITCSLLADVDAAIKPKVWLIHDDSPDRVSQYYLPTFAWVDLNFLEGQPKERLTAGLIEAIRIAIIWDRSLFEFIEQNLAAFYGLEMKSLLFLVHRVNAIKADILSKFRERTSAAKYLNFGKIITSVLLRHQENWEISPLEAAYLGPFIESVLACRMGVFPANEYQRVEALWLRMGIKVGIGKINFDILNQTVRQGGDHFEQFAFPSRIGEGILVNRKEV
jgi:3-dehydroquinate synthase